MARLGLDRPVELLAAQCGRLGLSHPILTADPRRVRVFVFAPARVQPSLDRVPERMLAACPCEGRRDPEAFPDEIGRRWTRTDPSPGEIGMVLGYPLEDVLGFLGMSPLPAATGDAGVHAHSFAMAWNGPYPGEALDPEDVRKRAGLS